MSPFFEHLVVVGIMSFLVALFTWIYVRDRQQSRGLWMIGWMAMLGHVTTNLFSGSALVSAQWIAFLRILALEMASVSFLLSFSEVYTGIRKRGVFLLVVGAPSVTYAACFIWMPGHVWVFPALLASTTVPFTLYALRHYGWKSLYFQILFLILLPYAAL